MLTLGSWDQQVSQQVMPASGGWDSQGQEATPVAWGASSRQFAAEQGGGSPGADVDHAYIGAGASGSGSRGGSSVALPENYKDHALFGGVLERSLADSYALQQQSKWRPGTRQRLYPADASASPSQSAGGSKPHGAGSSWNPAHDAGLDAEALLAPPWDLRTNDAMQAVREAAHKTQKTSSSVTQRDVTPAFSATGAGTREYNMMMNGWPQGLPGPPSTLSYPGSQPGFAAAAATAPLHPSARTAGRGSRGGSPGDGGDFSWAYGSGDPHEKHNNSSARGSGARSKQKEGSGSETGSASGSDVPKGRGDFSWAYEHGNDHANGTKVIPRKRNQGSSSKRNQGSSSKRNQGSSSKRNQGSGCGGETGSTSGPDVSNAAAGPPGMQKVDGYSTEQPASHSEAPPEGNSSPSKQLSSFNEKVRVHEDACMLQESVPVPVRNIVMQLNCENHRLRSTMDQLIHQNRLLASELSYIRLHMQSFSSQGSAGAAVGWMQGMEQRQEMQAEQGRHIPAMGVVRITSNSPPESLSEASVNSIQSSFNSGSTGVSSKATQNTSGGSGNGSEDGNSSPGNSTSRGSRGQSKGCGTAWTKVNRGVFSSSSSTVPPEMGRSGKAKAEFEIIKEKKKDKASIDAKSPTSFASASTGTSWGKNQNHNQKKQATVGVDGKPVQPRFWTPDEHDKFLEAAKLFGHGNVHEIARYVGTRTVAQVRTHSQKYFVKLEKMRGNPKV